MDKFYITTAIDYVNAAPHMGHALEKIQADVFARYHRLRGESVFFLTGTDEHGVKIARAADMAGKEPQNFVDENAEKFMALKNALNLSFDDFIRTTDRVRHWPAAIKMWQKLSARGDIYKKAYRGLYCVGHEAFVTEKDLTNGICRDHGKPPELIEEENYFFRLSHYANEIASKIKSDEIRILPRERKNEIISFIEGGLEDVSFSRPRKDLSWGIPVPEDEHHTMYVWADALTNYISAIGYGIDNAESKKRFSSYWPADVHVVGKDILRFHAAIWPGMLLSAELPLPKQIFVHGFISIEGEKMSKTLGNVVDPVAIAEKYGVNALRYYLLREIPSGGDGDFSEKKFRALYNADLANGLGNFVSRVLALAERSGTSGKERMTKNEGQRTKDKELRTKDKERKTKDEIIQKIETTRAIVGQKIDEFKLHEALAAIWELITFGDGYLNEAAPWKVENDERRAEIVGNLLFILEAVGGLIEPFLPSASEKIKNAVVRESDTFRAIKIAPLFPRLVKEI